MFEKCSSLDSDWTNLDGVFPAENQTGGIQAGQIRRWPPPPCLEALSGGMPYD